MTASPPAWPTLDCLGVNVARTTWPELKAWLLAPRIAGMRARSLYFANAHSLTLAAADAAYRDVLNRGDAVVNDGAGLELYARLAGTSFAENLNGTDLFPRLFREANREITVFLFGAARGRADEAARSLSRRFPRIRVVGTLEGFSDRDALDIINSARPDVLLVGLGNPRQERWIDANLAVLDVGVAAGVGALIDFLSGRVPRAPAVLRRLRLEWAFRLAREPRRLFARYVIGNPLFILRSVRYIRARQRRRG